MEHFFDLFHFLDGRRFVGVEQFVEQLIDIVGATSHPMLHHVVGKRFVAQKLRHFAPQIDEPLADFEVVFGVVVQTDRVFRHIHLPTQFALRGIGHKGRVRGRVERENPALLAVFLRRLCRCFASRFGQSVELVFVGDMQFECLVFLQQILRELQREQAGFLGELAQAFLALVVQQRTTAHKTVVAVPQQHFLFGRQRFGVQSRLRKIIPEIRIIHLLDSLKQRSVEHNVILVLRENRAHFLRQIVQIVVGFGVEHI